MLRRQILKKLMKKSSKKTPQSFVPQLYQLCPPWQRRCLPSLSVAYMNEPRAELRGSVHDPKWSPTRNDPQNRPKHEANWSAYHRLLSPIPRARSIQPKFQPFRPGKVVHLKRWTRFFEPFPVEPIHWVLDRNFQKFWLNGSRPWVIPQFFRTRP